MHNATASRDRVHRWREAAIKLALPVALFGLWCGLSYGGVVSSLFLPSPGNVLQQLLALCRKGDVMRDVSDSLLRVTAGFTLSAVAAILIGIWMGTSVAADRAILPTIAFIRYIPATALIPLGILWLGVGLAQSIGLVFLSIFFYLTLMVADLARTVPPPLLETAQTLGATRRQIILRVILPFCLPEIWNAMRTMWGVGWTMLVVVELVGSTTGIGAMIIRAQRFLQTATVFAGVVLVGVIGVLSDFAFRILRPLLFPWTRTARDGAP